MPSPRGARQGFSYDLAASDTWTVPRESPAGVGQAHIALAGRCSCDMRRASSHRLRAAGDALRHVNVTLNKIGTRW